MRTGWSVKLAASVAITKPNIGAIERSIVREVVERVFIIAKAGRRVEDVRNITVAISNELRDITRQISNNLRDIKRATYVCMYVSVTR